MSYSASPIKFIPGVNPEPDETKQNTRHIIDGDNIRFYRGGVQKIGGHATELVDTTIQGCPRSMFSFTDSTQKTWLVIGTHLKLYAKNGSAVTNITPLETVAAATLGTDPLALVSGDKTMTVTYTAHGLAVGDRIKLSGATHGTGGFATANINVEHIVATVPTADTFTVEIAAAAPATDATEGGASVQIFLEIGDGQKDAVNATGPFIGVPWTGLPYNIQTDLTQLVQPRIWWMDAFGDKWVGGVGQGGKCYQWDGDIAEAPIAITNAPLADYGWVEDAKLVTLLGNRVKNSNTGDFTDWTVTAASSAYEDDKEDATKLISRIYVNGENLIFAEEGQIFRLRWVGGTVKWLWEKVSDTIGIISPMGAITVGGIAYIFAREGLYYYNGGIISPLPDNTLIRSMFDNINLDQRYKCFVWFNQKYNELWFHYPDGTENDKCTIFSITEGHYTPRTIDRTAADSEGQVSLFPTLADSNGIIYQHEVGYNNSGAAMQSYFRVAYRAIEHGKLLSFIEGMEPDLIQEGDVTITLCAKERSTDSGNPILQTFTFAENGGKIDCAHEARWFSWYAESNVIDGFYRIGSMKEFISSGGIT